MGCSCLHEFRPIDGAALFLRGARACGTGSFSNCSCKRARPGGRRASSAGVIDSQSVKTAVGAKVHPAYLQDRYGAARHRGHPQSLALAATSCLQRQFW
jgi:hypothetical protein